MENKQIRYVNWQIFSIILVITMATIGAVYATAYSASQTSQENRVDIRELKTDLKNIDKTLVEIKDILKK